MAYNYYEILGVSRWATLEEIKRAYRKLAMEFHPDRNNGNKWREAKLKEINEAYGVLSDPAKRAHYDRITEEPKTGSGFSGNSYTNNSNNSNRSNSNSSGDEKRYSYSDRTEQKESEPKDNAGLEKKAWWRFIKVLYFIITVPLFLLILLWMAVSGIFSISHWQYVKVFNGYSYLLCAGSLFAGYTIVTELLVRLVTYIFLWKFEWSSIWKKLKKSPRKNWGWSVVGVIFLILVLSGSSQDLKQECTWPHQLWNDNWICSCESGYESGASNCVMTLNQQIINKIPYGAFLREYKQVPEAYGVYLGIYVKNYTIDSPNIIDASMPYSSCPEEAQWQWITGEYHIFTFENGEITSDVTVPWIGHDNFNTKMDFSYKNTKSNNYYFFGWEKPSDSEHYDIEQSDLINFKDYTGDGLGREFLLISGQDEVCWHKDYLVAWYDGTTRKAIIYPINKTYRWFDSSGYEWFWGDNFIPNAQWHVQNSTGCDHDATKELVGQYEFNKSEKEYILTNSYEHDCDSDFSSYTPQSTTESTRQVLQDVNFRVSPSANGALIGTPIQTNEYVTVLGQQYAEGQTWYNVSYNGLTGWISQIAFVPKTIISQTEDTWDVGSNDNTQQQTNIPSYRNSDFQITAPSTNPYKTTESVIKITGNVPSWVVTYITINDFRLTKFVPQSSTWYYFANKDFWTLNTGINLYTIKYYGSSGELLKSDLVTIVVGGQ